MERFILKKNKILATTGPSVDSLINKFLNLIQHYKNYGCYMT